ncbi:hypothetical protein Tco_0012483, partial [Tanacetum coccineum]
MSAPTSKFRGENVVFLKCKNDDLNLQKCLEKVHKLWKPYEVFIAMMCYSDAVMSRCRLLFSQSSSNVIPQNSINDIIDDDKDVKLVPSGFADAVKELNKFHSN